MKKTILLLSIIYTCTWATAQSVDSSNLTWHVDGFHNKSNNEDVTLASRFETSPQQIRWSQKGGAFVYDFEVTGKTGSWTELQVDGEVTFEVTFRGQSGTIRFARTQGKITIETSILKDGQNLLPYVFTVSSTSTR
jgi:hypothetical protein